MNTGNENDYKIKLSLLLSKGYFPEELPPCFTSEDLGDFINDSRFNVESYNTGRQSKPIPFSIPRIKGYRRLLSIPPIHQHILLCHEIVYNWEDISQLTSRSKFSVFDIDQWNSSQRFIAKPDFDKFLDQRIIRSTGYRYLLVVDIMRFYSSIYTHSIAWAVHSKDFSKANIGHEFWGNKLDYRSRKLQDNQTVGIPIGPDSSRIISELILSAIDNEISKELPDLKGIRNVDDYYFYFRNIGDLEKGRLVIQKCLKEFELELNLSKEQMIELPEVLESEWYSIIRNFKFRNEPQKERIDLISFFDKCFFFARKFPDDAVLTYSIAKLKSTFFHVDNYEILQSYLLNSLVLESKIVWQVAFEFLKYSELDDGNGYAINRKLVSEAFSEFLAFHAQLDNHFEVVWALWLASEMELNIDVATVQTLNQTTNSLIILLLLSLERLRLLPIELNKDTWKQLINPSNLNNENWILVYEAFVNNWLEIPADFELGNAFYERLSKKGVEFFKPDREPSVNNYSTSGPKGSLTKILEERFKARNSNVHSPQELQIDSEDLGIIVSEDDDLPF